MATLKKIKFSRPSHMNQTTTISFLKNKTQAELVEINL